MVTSPRPNKVWSEAIAVAILIKNDMPLFNMNSGAGANGRSDVRGNTLATVSPFPMGMPPPIHGSGSAFVLGSTVGVFHLKLRALGSHCAVVKPSNSKKTQNNIVQPIHCIHPFRLLVRAEYRDHRSNQNRILLTTYKIENKESSL